MSSRRSFLTLVPHTAASQIGRRLKGAHAGLAHEVVGINQDTGIQASASWGFKCTFSEKYWRTSATISQVEEA